MEKPANSFKCYMVSWDEAYQLAKSLANKIKRSGFRPDMVIGVARGGFVPARIVCDILLQKDLTSIRVEHWGIASNLGKAKIKYSLPEEVDIAGKRILIVDDVADTGGTYAAILDYMKGKAPAEIKTASLHYKTCSSFIPDYWGEKQDSWQWIIYPWAVYEDIVGFIEKVLVQPMMQNDIRKALLHSFDIKIQRTELLEILDDMHLAGELKKTGTNRKIFWEYARIK
ncbi:Xanthine phosphoribosyltransferase [uncultured archaeon]|nr:Xanthine phosphoribosyltransferase [uncultured archaeon]